MIAVRFIINMLQQKEGNFLFLDRDGVINTRIPGAYVTQPAEFIFCDGAVAAIALLTAVFDRIVVVTNQAGVGKGLMTSADLDRVHEKMLDTIAAAGGKIDAVYYCPNKPADKAPCRKPETGMALQAKADFPEIDFETSWIVGDSASDMKFGKKMGMKTALVTGKTEEEAELAVMPLHWRGNSLLAFAEKVLNLK